MTSEVERFPLNALASRISEPVDVFICSASFEDRCRSVPDALSGRAPLRFPLICYIQKTVPHVLRNLESLQQSFQGAATKVPIYATDPVRTADRMQAALSRVVDTSRPQNYLVDITTFTHEALLILLRLLQRQVTKLDSVRLVYASADEYSVGIPPEEKWLSKGVREVRSVLGYPGMSLPSRRSHLIMLVGFETDRALEVIDSQEPAVISLGFGEEETSTGIKHYAVNRLVLARVADRVKNYNEFSFSASDPFQAEAAVTEQVRRVPDANTLIAPMNTKISTVGAAGAAFGNGNVRVCYASAVTYNVDRYSKPGDTCYLMSMPYEFWCRAATGSPT